MKVDIEKVKYIVAKMMTEENDTYSKLTDDLDKYIDTFKMKETMDKLSLVHKAKINILEEAYKRISQV